MIEINRNGYTRTVILTKSFAIKIPTLKNWRGFLEGLVSNINETKFSKLGNRHLCPVVFGTKCGLIVVMKRAKKINNDGLFLVELARLKCEVDSDEYSDSRLGWGFFMHDSLKKNYGYLNGKLVKIDYGI